MTSGDATEDLRDAVLAAAETGKSLSVEGGNTKQFLGRRPSGAPLATTGHCGIVSYEPTELVVTARAGTRLVELEKALADHGQMLGFEPPHFGDQATLGGTMACGLSGPRRVHAGAARDFTLGTKVITATGEVLAFGGQVMKNVAGYDVSRLMVGAMGTLGVLLEFSLKVLPRPPCELTLRFECEVERALERMNAWARMPLPLSAAAHVDGLLYARLSGTDTGTAAASARLGGEPADPEVWARLREQAHPAFQGEGTLWRLSVPSHAPLATLGPPNVVEWSGGQRWLRSGAEPERIRTAARALGGHAVQFRDGDRDGEIFHPLEPRLAQLHRGLKSAFDAPGIFNPGRMYRDL